MIVSLLLIIVCILVAGFYAGAETGAYRLNRIHLRSEAQKGSLSARVTESVVANMERFVCMTLAGHNIAVYGATAFCTALVAFRIESHLLAELVSTLLLAPFLLVLAEVVPKSLFQVIANPLMRIACFPLWVSDKFFYPIVRVLMGVVAFWRWALLGNVGPRQLVVSSQYISSLLATGTQEGVITSQQDTMARNILQLGTRPLRDVMVPISRVRMLSADVPGDEAMRSIGEFGRSRLPVYEGEQTNIVGILRVIDYLCEGQGGPIRPFIRPPMFLDAATSVDDAFRQLQEAGQTMALVRDTRERAIGAVTVDDLLQSILRRIGA